MATPQTTNRRASDTFFWVSPHEEEEGPHEVIGPPLFWDHVPLQQEAPELCHDDCSHAKKLAEGSHLCQWRPASAALILDVLANEDEILWQGLRFTYAFVAAGHVGRLRRT